MKPRHPALNAPRGFGLIEQIITMVLLAILAAMAVPAFHRMLEGHELRVAQTDYIVALQHARNLAVNEQARVIFCPSQDALTCSGSHSWGSGWLIGLVDAKKKTQMAGSPRYTGRGYRDALTVASNSSRNYVWFGPDGSAVGTEQSFFFCVKDDPQRILSVVISKVGRVRGETLQNTDKFQCPTTQ